MPRFGVKILVLLAGIVIFITGFEGNTGKALACIITPGTLEVDINGGQNANAGPAQPA